MADDPGFPMWRRWGGMRSPEFAALDPQQTVAVLPLGAVEQHGPHLPLETDLAVAEEVIWAAQPHCTGPQTVLVLPPSPFGASIEHESFPGTLSIDPTTLAALWTDIGRSVARAGVRKLVMVNAHGGQRDVMGPVARRLRKDCGMLVVPVSWTDFRVHRAHFPKPEHADDIHAGPSETALMLHMAPGTVDLSAIEDRPRMGESVLGVDGIDRAWMAEDLNPSGAVGRASLGTAEIGRAILDDAGRAIADVLARVAGASLPGTQA